MNGNEPLQRSFFGLAKAIPSLFRVQKPTSVARVEVTTQQAPRVKTWVDVTGPTYNVETHKYANSMQRWRYSTVHSFKGDNAMVTTDTPLLGLCLLHNDNLIGMRFTPKDIGFSKVCHDGGEDLLYPPINYLSHPNMVQRYAASEIPSTSDVYKLILLNPARKSSGLETDLASKLTPAVKAALWTNPSWISYDDSQLGLIMAYATFDLTETYQSPAIFLADGGCGGHTPYRNPDTTRALIHATGRGRDSRATYGIMREVSLVTTTQIKPSQMVFLPFVHQVQSGTMTYLRSASAFLRARNETGSTSLLKEFLKQDLDPIPEEVERHAVVYPTDDVLIGAQIAALQRSGHVMTELDVRLALAAKEKGKALKGTTPIREVNTKFEEKILKIRSQSLQLLTEIYGHEADPTVVERLKNLPEDRVSRNMIISAYYQAHSYDLTSFMYSDEVKIYPKHLVEGYFGNSQRAALLNSLIDGRTPSKTAFAPKSIRTPEPEIEAWIERIPTEPMSLPPWGLATRDGQLMNYAVNNLYKKFPTYFLLFSSDSGLHLELNKHIRLTANRRGLHQGSKILRISAERFAKHTIQRLGNDVGRVALRIPNHLGGVTCYSERELHKLAFGHIVCVLFDEPNLVKRLATYKSIPRGYTKILGGLTHQFTKSFPTWGYVPRTDLNSYGHIKPYTENYTQGQRYETLYDALISTSSYGSLLSG